MIEKSLPGNGAITSGIYKSQMADIINDADPGIDIEIEKEPGVEVLEIEVEIAQIGEHHENLLETVFADEESKKRLDGLVTDLLQQYEDDLITRSKWEETYRDGLELLGLQFEERSEPWEGACGVFHPLLTEAVVRFQAETITETFPAGGPVKTQVIGKQTPARMAAADRVKDDMNWRLTDEMPEYRIEHERMLWNLPIAGSAFKKIYIDQDRGRQVAIFVPAEDIVVNYGTTDIESAERVTHVMRRSENWLKKMIEAGTYSDVPIGQPEAINSETREAKDKLIGFDSANNDSYEILEMLVDLIIEPTGEEEDEQAVAWPYVVTINKSNSELLSIRRNWSESDKKKRKLNHFVHYTYITGFGFYGFGLIHLIGNHAKAATSMTRQLVDAGTLANLQGGFKTRGMRVKDDDKPVRPGEFKDVDIPSGPLRDNIVMLPYKEPSATLVNLLNSIVEDGRRAASISDAAFTDANQNAPVGTTLALIERQLKTLSAVQARVHSVMRQEFKLLKELIKNNGEREYPYEADPDKRTKTEDYDITEIIPVSDPNASTMGVRIAQYQAVLQLSEKTPQLYDQAYLHREMLATLGVKNAAKIVPMPEEQKPRDPVSENMAILMSKPVRAFVQQDHQSHIMVHQGLLTDPKIGMLLGQNPNAQLMFNQLQAHIAEHAAYAYRDQVQKALGVELPDPNQEMDEQTEYELAGLLAQAAGAVHAQNQNEQAQAQAQQAAQDPVLQLQKDELQIKSRDVGVKEGKLQLEREIAVGEGKIGVGTGQPPVDPEKQAKAQATMIMTQEKSRTEAQNRQLAMAKAVAEQRRLAQASGLDQQMKLRTQLAANRRADRASDVDTVIKTQKAEADIERMKRQSQGDKKRD